MNVRLLDQIDMNSNKHKTTTLSDPWLRGGGGACAAPPLVLRKDARLQPVPGRARPRRASTLPKFVDSTGRLDLFG